MTHEESRNIAAKAWEKVKGGSDPSFNQCATIHQAHLAYKVESVAKTGTAEDDFDRAAQAILSKPTEVVLVHQTEPKILVLSETPPVARKPKSKK